jgi:hypothetical protein
MFVALFIPDYVLVFSPKAYISIVPLHFSMIEAQSAPAPVTLTDRYNLNYDIIYSSGTVSGFIT